VPRRKLLAQAHPRRWQSERWNAALAAGVCSRSRNCSAHNSSRLTMIWRVIPCVRIYAHSRS
jgi:hypothetical protein